MKRKTIFYSIALLGVASMLTFTACKKKKEFKNEDGQSSEDNRNTASENDNAMNDVNDVMASSSLKGRGANSYDAKGITGNVHGASLDSTNIGNGTIKINFDGVTSYNNRIRGGSIKLTVQGWPNVKWKDAGAITKVEFLSYKVTKTSNGNYIELNGSQLYKNVSGTTWWDLLITTAHKSIVSEVTDDGGLVATFSDGKTATYHINRRITYSYLGPHPQWRFQCTAEGIGSSDGISNLENYGTTRDGDAFTSQVTTPIVWNTDCGWWAPTQGAVSVKVKDKEFSLDCTFAVDNSGTPVTVAPNSCAYGWKVEWKHKKKTNKKIFPY
jgi:hypothetical protein